MNKLSICIPTYNRFEMTLESFRDVYCDERVHSIIILDDASTDGSYEQLLDATSSLTKIKIYRQEQNVDCYRNKFISVTYCPTEFCILLDSDNRIDISYLDAIYSEQWDAETIFTPEFAMPEFDFRNYSGLTLSKENIAQYVDKPLFETMLNAANYFVNRNNYIWVWDKSVDPVTSDSIFQSYNWLKAGYKIKVLPGLQYEHRVWPGSHYQNNVHRTPNGFHQSVLDKLKQMS